MPVQVHTQNKVLVRVLEIARHTTVEKIGLILTAWSHSCHPCLNSHLCSKIKFHSSPTTCLHFPPPNSSWGQGTSPELLSCWLPQRKVKPCQAGNSQKFWSVRWLLGLLNQTNFYTGWSALQKGRSEILPPKSPWNRNSFPACRISITHQSGDDQSPPNTHTTHSLSHESSIFTCQRKVRHAWLKWSKILMPRHHQQ